MIDIDAHNEIETDNDRELNYHRCPEYRLKCGYS